MCLCTHTLYSEFWRWEFANTENGMSAMVRCFICQYLEWMIQSLKMFTSREVMLSRMHQGRTLHCVACLFLLGGEGGTGMSFCISPSGTLLSHLPPTIPQPIHPCPPLPSISRTDCTRSITATHRRKPYHKRRCDKIMSHNLMRQHIPLNIATLVSR